MPQKHKVFISYYHDEDQWYKDRFVRRMGNLIVDRSVDVGDIVDSNLPVDEIRRQIRDDYIRDATVTIVLIGPRTWQRKHVDWEIHSSLRDTDYNRRCGLLGILLPEHPNFQKREYNPRLIPPRLARNCGADVSYAVIYDWTRNVANVQNWIQRAFQRRNQQPDPDTNLQLFADNRTGNPSRGWQN